ncbi:MAG: ABC transporter permease [Solirubrobacterales bacterium]
MSEGDAAYQPASVDPLVPGAPPELPASEAKQPSQATNRKVLGLALPAAGYMMLLLVIPVIALLAYSVLTAGFFSVSGPLTLDNFKQALESELTWTLGRNAMIVGLLTAAISVAVSIPVAYWLRYHAGRWQMLALFLIAVSMFASYLVRIYAWRSILGSRGVLNSALLELGVIHEPLGFFIFNRAAIVIALVHISIPYVILVLYAAFRPLEPRYLEAARDLGGNSWQRWRRVILPLIAGPAASAFIFIFVLASADFVTPQFLGGAGDSMLGLNIAQQFTSSGNWALGAALSALMLIVYALCFTVTAIALRLVRLDKIRWTT